jgi:spermidine synthase
LSGERERLRRWASHLLMMASGAAAMGYEIVWTQQSSLWLGHESAAVLAVVAAFFGGLALGGLLLGSRIEVSARPVYWYAGCELVVALWSLLLLFGASPFSDRVLRTVVTEEAIQLLARLDAEPR